MTAKLALGTVQLGMKYGRANKHGMPCSQDAENILKKAEQLGVTDFDTASAYGQSEAVIGGVKFNSIVQVSTKLSPLSQINSDFSAQEIRNAVASDIDNSLKNLQKEQLDVLMLHRWQHRKNPVIWKTLLEYKEKNIIKKLGASVSNPQEALEALADDDVEFIQLPINIIDWRWEEAGVDRAALTSGKLIQARSALLQGILVSDGSIWPNVDGVDADLIINRIDDLVVEFGRKNRADLCYAYLRALPWISSVVVGMETEEQLVENAELFSLPPLDEKQCQIIRKTFNNIPEGLLNPALWK